MPVDVSQLVTLTLDFTRGNNLTAQGSVSFAPPRFIVGDTVVTPKPVQAKVQDGLGTIKLIPVDGGTYQVSERLDNLPVREYNVNIPTSSAGNTIKLKDLAPVNPLIPGVAQNTLRSGFTPPNSGVGVDGDYYYDITAHFWYGPKANGVWPAGFSLVGPKGDKGDDGADGTNGTNGTNGTVGPAGRGIASAALNVDNLVLTYTDAATQDVGNVRGPKGDKGDAGTGGGGIKTADQYFTSGDLNPLPNTGGVWASVDREVSIPAAINDRIRASIHGMRNASGSVFLDAGVLVGSAPTLIKRFLATGTSTPAAEGDPGFYNVSGFINQSAARRFVVTSDYLDGGVVRVGMVCRGNGTGIMYSSAGYPLYILLENLGPEPA